jgi:hypothetical protein
MNRMQRREMMRKMQSEDLSLEVIHPDAEVVISATNPTMHRYRQAGTVNRYDVSDAPRPS